MDVSLLTTSAPVPNVKPIICDVMSGAAFDYVGMDVRANFCDSRLKSAELFGSLASRTRFTHSCAAFNCILQPNGNSYRRHIRQLIGPVVSDKPVKSREHKAVCLKTEVIGE